MALEYIEPKIFDKSKIFAGVSTRNGSVFPKYGLSLSKAEILTDGDLNLHRRTFARLLGVPYDSMKYQKQIHSDIINEIFADSPVMESDGMFTSVKDLMLNISIADCAAVLIHDPINEVVMGIHSGWKGTSQNIVSVGIQRLIDKCGSRPEDLLVYISPAASGLVYEVGEEVAKYFPRSVTHLYDDKYLFDNKQEIRLQLMDCGVLEANIEVSAECTMSSYELHSFRRDKEKSGRMSAFIMMKSEPALAVEV